MEGKPANAKSSGKTVALILAIVQSSVLSPVWDHSRSPSVWTAPLSSQTFISSSADLPALPNISDQFTFKHTSLGPMAQLYREEEELAAAYIQSSQETLLLHFWLDSRSGTRICETEAKKDF